jgi:hypothetical protein
MTINKKAGQNRTPRYKRVNSLKTINLNERDVEIIKQVNRHRFLTSEHITALIDGSRQNLLRRLQLLYHSEYLDRPKEQIKPSFYGSKPMVYALGNKGADLLAELYNQPRLKVDWTTKNKQATNAFLDHTLMIANFMVCLDLACRKIGGVRLIGSKEIYEKMPVKGGKKASPFAWEVNVKREVSGKVRDFKIGILPDKVFGIHFEQDNKAAFFFLEADRSTMPIMRAGFQKSSYLKKIVAYWQSYRAEIIKEMFGFKAPRVLTIALSQERINNMIAANKEVDERKKGFRMFYFSKADAFSVSDPERVFKRIWLNGRDEDLCSLID